MLLSTPLTRVSELSLFFLDLSLIKTHIFYSQKKAGLESAKAIYKVGYRHAYQSCCQASFRDGGTPLHHNLLICI